MVPGTLTEYNMTKFEFKYGKTKKYFEIPKKNIIDVLEMHEVEPENRADKALENALNNPFGKKQFKELINDKGPKNIVIIVSDITRPGPFNQILNPLLSKLERMRINFKIEIVIASGTHREMTEKEMRYQYGDYAVDNYPIYNHNCRADDLVNLGSLKSGIDLKINRKVYEADFLITIGILKPHYFAGFSGGRKSILPGICGYETIRANHSKIIYKYARLGKMRGNKISKEMQEAADKVGVDFAINMLLNQNKKIVHCLAGDITKILEKGSKIYKKEFSVKFDKKADIVFASVGGYPKDLNFYQSQKTLNNVIGLVKENGTVVLVTASEEGIGQTELERVLLKANNLQELFDVEQSKIQIGGHRAFATGRLLQKADILVMSEMPDELVKNILFNPISSFAEAFNFIKKKHGEDYSAYVVPSGSSLYAVQN